MWLDMCVVVWLDMCVVVWLDMCVVVWLDMCVVVWLGELDAGGLPGGLDGDENELEVGGGGGGRCSGSGLGKYGACYECFLCYVFPLKVLGEGWWNGGLVVNGRW